MRFAPWRGAPTSMDIASDVFEAIAGDAKPTPSFCPAGSKGADAVILTLGVPRDIRALQPTTLFSSVTQALIPAMQDAGVRRLLTVTGFGAGDSHAKLSTPEKITMKLFLGRAYADKACRRT
jgi:hypothetical protein